MDSIAIKMGQTRERVPGMQEMGTLRCDGIWEEFVDLNDPFRANKETLRDRPGGSKKFWLKNTIGKQTSGSDSVAGMKGTLTLFSSSEHEALP